MDKKLKRHIKLCKRNLSIKRVKCCAYYPFEEEKHICAIIAEKKSVYYRFVLILNNTYTSYTLNRFDDVTYAPINFTVLPNEVCIMVADSDVQIFKGGQVKVISNPPFNSDTKLFNASGAVFFIEKDKIYSVNMKK